jgi:phage tail-like protein
MPTGGRVDPYRAHNFIVEIGGITRAGFREVSGLDAANDSIDYREGNDKDLALAKIPGLVKYSNITLKWGVTTDPDIWQWRKSAMDGKVERTNLSIVMLGEDGTEAKRWNVFEAWCSKLTMPSLNATGNDIAIETMEITHERLEEA